MKKTIAVILLILSSSCASIITGSTDDILVTSNPPGARFRTNLGIQGRTPQTISVPCKKELSVQFSMDGFEEASAHVGTRVSAWIAGNIVFGGLIGLVIDVAGHGYVHESDRAHAELFPVAPSARPAAASSQSHGGETFEEWEARKRGGRP